MTPQEFLTFNDVNIRQKTALKSITTDNVATAVDNVIDLLLVYSPGLERVLDADAVLTKDNYIYLDGNMLQVVDGVNNVMRVKPKDFLVSTVDGTTDGGYGSNTAAGFFINHHNGTTGAGVSIWGNANHDFGSGILGDLAISNTLGKISLVAPHLIISSLPTFADRAAAIAGGLITNEVYKDTAGFIKIV